MEENCVPPWRRQQRKLHRACRAFSARLSDLRRQSLSNWQCPTSLPRQRLAIRHSDGFRCGARSGWRSARTTSNRTRKAPATRRLWRRYSGHLSYFGPVGGLWRWQRVATVGRIIRGLSDRHPRPGSASGCDSVPSQCTDRRGDSRCEGGGSTRFPRAGFPVCPGFAERGLSKRRGTQRCDSPAGIWWPATSA